MKKGIILFGMLSVFAWTSCDNDNNKENTEENTYSSPPPAPAEPAPVVQTPPPAAPKQKDGTTIKVNEEGVSYESKEGGKKRNVNISGDSTSIEIKTPK